MVRPLIIALGSLLVFCTARAELQLTPMVSEFELDGIKLKQLAFFDGSKTITYQSPSGWEYSGSATRMVLRPANKPQAEATILRIPQDEPGKFDEESCAKLVSEAVELVPKGHEGVTVTSQEKNPLMINRKETFLLKLSYTLYGQKYHRSILFLNRGNEQIRFQLTARDSDFDELQAVFIRSHYTWQDL